MALTFEEKFEKDIKKMKEYLLSNKLKMISFTYTDGWKFKMSLPQKDYDKIQQKRKMDLVK